MINTIATYGFSALLLFLGFCFSLSEISAGIPLFLAGLIFLPSISPLIFKSANDGSVDKPRPTKKFKFLISFAAFCISFFMFIAAGEVKRNAERAEEAAKNYQQNPSLILDKAEADLAAKNYFKANYTIDGLLKALPNDEKLVGLKEKIFSAELKAHVSKKEFLHVPALFKNFRAVIPNAKNKDHDFLFFEKAAVEHVKDSIIKNDFIEAKQTLKYLDEAFPENTSSKTLVSQIESAKQEFDKKQAAIAKAKAEQEARAAQSKADEEARAAKAVAAPPVQSSSSAKSSDGTCVVTSILHPHAFECGSQLCSLDTNDRTIMIVNGNILPPHAARAHMVKPGYRCTCIRSQTMMATEKIECNG